MPTFRPLVLATLLAMPATAADLPPAKVAFVHVNVVPMESARVLRDQTVLVADGKVTAIGPSLPVPDGVLTIDGHGSDYLTPGLADMHTHADREADMEVYLANGVTTVLNMGDASNEFVAHVRPAVNRGEKPGPHIYAGFRVDGTPEYGAFVVTTPDEARWVVRLAKTNGYNFIKVYNNLSPSCFDALVEEGKRQHVPVIGHGVTRVGLQRQLAKGQVLVAHLEEYLYTFFLHPERHGGQLPIEVQADPAEIPQAIDFTRRARAYVTADLNNYALIARQWGRPEILAQFFERPELRTIAPADRLSWRDEDYARRPGTLQPRVEFLQRFVKALADANIPLVTGTDAPVIPGEFTGVSLHDDLRALEEAGLSRFQVLTAATRTPGEFIRTQLRGEPAFGTVTVGARADLLLVRGNPLDELAVLRAPRGVMANGRWYDEAGLQQMLRDVADAYDRAAAHR